MSLAPHARRLARELDLAIAEGDAQRVVRLVVECRLPREQRLEVCRELDRVGIPIREPVGFTYDRFDRARVWTVGDVWAR